MKNIRQSARLPKYSSSTISIPPFESQSIVTKHDRLAAVQTQQSNHQFRLEDQVHNIRHEKVRVA